MTEGSSGVTMENLDVREKPRIPPEREPMARRIEDAHRKTGEEIQEKTLRIKELNASRESDHQAAQAAKKLAAEKRDEAQGIENDASVLEQPLTRAQLQRIERLRAEAAEDERTAAEIQGRADSDLREITKLRADQQSLEDRAELLQTQLDRLATPDGQAPDADPQFAAKIREEANAERTTAESLRSKSDDLVAEAGKIGKEATDKQRQAQEHGAKSEQLRARSELLTQEAKELRASASEQLKRADSLAAQGAEEPDRAADFQRQAQAAQDNAARMTQRAGELQQRADAAHQEFETTLKNANELGDQAAELINARTKVLEQSEQLGRDAQRHEDSAKAYEDMAALTDIPPTAADGEPTAAENNPADELDFAAAGSASTDAIAGIEAEGDGDPTALDDVAVADDAEAPAAPVLDPIDPAPRVGNASLSPDLAETQMPELDELEVSAGNDAPEPTFETAFEEPTVETVADFQALEEPDGGGVDQTAELVDG